ncbi:MAG: histidine phosphatase family protein [Pseudomonadota bacterium]
MPERVTIYCIRHGQTDWNAEQRYQGQADIPLNDFGRGQAARNGSVLRDLPIDLTKAHYVASPLGRTVETMQIVRRQMGLDPDTFTTDPRLREVHYGHWEAKLLSDLPTLDPTGMKDRLDDPFNWRPRGGESYADLMQRIIPWVETLDQTTVVSTHGGISRTLRGHLLGMDMNNILELEVPQDKVLKISTDGMEWL